MPVKVVRTAKGKSLDLARLRLKNEEVVTVGNMRTNARGDKLHPKTGKVVETRNQIKSAEYRLHTNVPINKPVTQPEQPSMSPEIKAKKR